MSTNLRLFHIKRWALSMVYLLALIGPYTQNAYADGQGYNGIDSFEPPPFQAHEIKFAAEYSSYLKFTLQLQALEIKKKIYCLGFEELSNFYTLSEDSIDYTDAAKESLDTYKNSTECESFLSEMNDISRDYTDMRIMLGLHQSYPGEMDRRLMQSTGVGMQPHYPLINCDYVENPLRVKQTSLCLERLIGVVNPYPEHIISKSQIPILDNLMKNQNIPEISDLNPLTWEEVAKASLIFHEKFTENEITDYYVMNQEKVSEYRGERPPGFYDFQVERELEVIHQYGLKYLQYMNARDFQSHGRKLFSEHPEDSAPMQYIRSLSNYPFLVFLKPEKKVRDLDCSTNEIAQSELNLERLCESYLSFLNQRGDVAYKQVVTKRSVAEALVTSLELNQLLVQTFDENYPLQSLLNEDGEFLETVPYHSLSSWAKLMEMENVKGEFFKLFPDLEGADERLIEVYDRQELNKAILSITGAVGLGFACYFVGNFWGSAACLALSGAGVNLMFYNQAYKNYERNFGMFFAKDISNKEGLLTLIEFSKLNSRLQDLYLEKVFLFIGTGAADIVSRTLKRIK